MMSNSIKVPDTNNTDEFKSEPAITPKEGGIFTPIQSWHYPFKGYPLEINVEVLAAVKGVIPVALKFIEQSIKHFDLLALWSAKNCWKDMLLYCGKVLGRRQPQNPKRYSRVVREIYRVITLKMGEKNEELFKQNRELWCDWHNFRVLICTICEFDTAYRYRMQDFLTELNKENLIKNPIKELRRVLQIMIDRESREFIANKWKRLKLILTLVLFLKPSLKHKIISMLMEINKEEIKFEDDDWYCIAMRHDYKFGGFTKEEVIRNKGYEVIKVELRGGKPLE